MYFYYDNNGVVTMYSDGENQTILNKIRLTPTSDEIDKLELNYKSFIKNNKLVLEKPDWLISEEKEQQKQNLKKQLESVNTIKDLKNILKELL